jgi:hypothetical protein
VSYNTGGCWRTKMRFPLILLLCALLFASSIVAQSPNGTINGQVLDPAGGAIADAGIVILNDATSLRYTTKTNAEGIYVLPNLPPGPYRLQVSKVGFKTLIKPDIVLNVQDALAINFTLPIGALAETVTVEGGAPVVDTESAAVSTVVDQTFVKNMPLNGRSFQDLILLTPGIVTETSQGGEGGDFSVNGQRTHSNYYTVDGVSANMGTVAGQVNSFGGQVGGSIPAATALGTTQALVSVDDLQEFRALSSSYSAEYGRNPGGQFAFETKSGTKQWHGTGYNYLRNGAVDAQDWFNNYFGTPEPALRQNDFGGTLGGPVKIPRLYWGKDRTFFFVSYEGLRLTAPQAAMVTYVPDSALRASAPAGVRAALNAFPLPTANGIDDAANGIAQYVATWSNPSSLNSTSVRFDHVVSDSLRVFFRFSDTSSDLSSRSSFPTPSVPATSTYTMRTYTAGAASVFSNRLSNEFRINYSSNETTNRAVIDSFGGGAPVNLAQLSGLGSKSFPFFELAYGGYLTELAQWSHAGAQKQWNLVDTVNLSAGRHQFKFGVDYRRLAPVAAESSPLFGYIFLSEADVLSNNPLVLAIPFAPAYPLYKNFSAFAQDEWKVFSNLTLSLGLRWEVNPAPTVTRGLEPYTIQGSGPSTWMLAPQGTPLWKTTWYNFAPRLGAAYVLHHSPGRENVIHGGVGIFFDTGQQLGSLGFNGPGFSAQKTFFAPFPVVDGAKQVPAIVNPPASPYSAISYGFNPHLQLPYTFQWNISVEQALGKSQALTASYVGSHASRLLENIEFRPAENPNIQDAYFVENGLTSDYDALQFQFRRRLSRGLTALASYTWSHCIDYGSGNFFLGYLRGNCNFDVRHSVSAAFSYDLPNVGDSKFLRGVLSHWGLDDRVTVRTSFPVTLYGSQQLQPNGEFFYTGLNFVPGQPVYLYGANCDSVLQGIGDLQPGQRCPGGRAINPNAFTNVTSGVGNVPRNYARGFGACQMDLAVRREFPIHESLKLQFRAEAFNLLNHPNFGTVNDQFGQSNFGQATGTLANSSMGVLNPLYRTGGPRSMQVALRIIF